MRSQQPSFIWLAVLAFAVFGGLLWWRGPLQYAPQPEVADRVVISAPVQVLLAGGDRFLASNLEVMRVMATAEDSGQDAEAEALYRIRAHQVASELNPCQEDNYYVANAMLTWGGAPSEGLDVLKRATDCRFWDEFPPFFLGFNEWFFNRDAKLARDYFELAADRSTDNAAAMRRMGIMIEAGEFADDRAALAFLEQEIQQAKDDKLREMLEKRLLRLQGLIALREAQTQYEAEQGTPLTEPRALIDKGYLADFPTDPLRLGYEFEDGHFRFREMKVPGMESRP